MYKCITISIASYNVEKTLKQAVESVLSTDKRDLIEILIINDGSSDGTFEIGKDYEKQYPGIIRMIDKKNGGYGSTVNAAIENATGKYFKLLDGDDWFNHEGFSVLVDFLEYSDVDMVITDYVEIWGNKRKKDISYNIQSGELLSPQDVKDNISMHALCYKTSVLRMMDEKLNEKCLYTDAEFALYPMYYISNVYYLKQNVYCYSLGNNGQSVSKQSRIKNLNDARKVYRAVMNYDKKHHTNNGLAMTSQKIAASYVFYIESLLLCPISSKIKAEICEEEQFADKEGSRWFVYTNNLKLKILRKSKYVLYPICSLYMKIFE